MSSCASYSADFVEVCDVDGVCDVCDVDGVCDVCDVDDVSDVSDVDEVCDVDMTRVQDLIVNQFIIKAK